MSNQNCTYMYHFLLISTMHSSFVPCPKNDMFVKLLLMKLQILGWYLHSSPFPSPKTNRKNNSLINNRWAIALSKTLMLVCLKKMANNSMRQHKSMVIDHNGVNSSIWHLNSLWKLRSHSHKTWANCGDQWFCLTLDGQTVRKSVLFKFHSDISFS